MRSGARKRLHRIETLEGTRRYQRIARVKAWPRSRCWQLRRSESLWQGSRWGRCSARALRPRVRRTRLLSIDRSEQLFHGTRRRRSEHLVEADRLRELLADEFVALREFAVLC